MTLAATGALLGQPFLAADDDLLAGFDATPDLHEARGAHAKLDLPRDRLAVDDDPHEVAALEREHRVFGDDDRVGPRLRREPRLDEHAGLERRGAVGDDGLHGDGASRELHRGSTKSTVPGESRPGSAATWNCTAVPRCSRSE